jgi:hypothetical protein
MSGTRHDEWIGTGAQRRAGDNLPVQYLRDWALSGGRVERQVGRTWPRPELATLGKTATTNRWTAGSRIARLRPEASRSDLLIQSVWLVVRSQVKLVRTNRSATMRPDEAIPFESKVSRHVGNQGGEPVRVLSVYRVQKGAGRTPVAEVPVLSVDGWVGSK